MSKQTIDPFIQFLNRATSPALTVNLCKKMLNEAGFQERSVESLSIVSAKNKYYITPYDGMLIAFSTGAGDFTEKPLKMVASHIDSPSLKIKPNPEIKKGNILKLNTEVYGGPILNTWFDRLLSCSGQVAIRSTNPLKPTIKTVDFKEPFLTIPNCAIHLNPELNKGLEYNKQQHFQPIVSVIDEETTVDHYLMQQLANQLNVNVKDILDFDLHVYIAEPASLLGINKQLISSPRLDNLAMVYSSLAALVNATPASGISMAVCFDHEEIGSRTKQGGQGAILKMILQQILQSDNNTVNYLKTMRDSVIISADAAHATHPNYPEKSDETNQPKLNKGMTIKYSGNKKYATDSETAAIIKQLCETANLPYQTYVNRSDIAGGSTIGPMIESLMGIKTVDIGPPMLAMHSARELMGVNDFFDAITLFETFYNI